MATPSVPRLGRRRRRRFAAALPPGLDPDDALLWLRHPGLTGPSGAAGPAAVLAEARRALYRPDVGAGPVEAVVELQRRLDAQRLVTLRALEDSAPAPRHGLRRGAAVGVPVVLLVAAVALPVVLSTRTSGTPAADPPSLTTDAGTPARTLRVTADERDRILALLASGAGDRMLRNRVQSAVDQTADGPVPADGSRVAAVDGIIGGRAAGSGFQRLGVPSGGAITVAVVLDRAVPWGARLVTDGPDDPVVRGTAEGGRLQYALLLLPTSSRATGVAFDVPDGVGYAWQVLRRG